MPRAVRSEKGTAANAPPERSVADTTREQGGTPPTRVALVADPRSLTSVRRSSSASRSFVHRALHLDADSGAPGAKTGRGHDHQKNQPQDPACPGLPPQISAF